jgi:hypothetical protein
MKLILKIFLLFLLKMVLIPTIVFGQCILGDCENGKGTYKWGNGNIYVGEWKNGKQNGHGDRTWNAEDELLQYIGEYKDNLEINGYYITPEAAKCGVKWYCDNWQFENRSYTIIWPFVKYTFSRRGEDFRIDFNKIINDYVTYKFNEWQKKGEFEKIANYNLRVNDDSRKKIVEKFKKEAIDELEREFKSSVNYKKIKLNIYDSENETFTLVSNYIGEFVLNVPIDKAPSFKENFDLIKFKDKEYILLNNKFLLSSFKVIDKDGNEFIYNNHN